MAKFKRVKMNDEGWDAVCTAIRNALAASESVEVVAILRDNGKGKVEFEVRAWNDVRTDGSNSEDAKEGKNY
jgi:hypothetical protein